MLEAEFIIKVCGVTSIADAHMAVDAGANALGFNFYSGSPRYLTISEARKIAVALGTDILRVGVFLNASIADLVAIVAEVPLDVLQLHGTGPVVPDGFTHKIWRAIHVANGRVTEPAGPAQAYLVDSMSPGSGQTFDWSYVRGFPHRMIVAGGLDGMNVAQAIAALHPWGVDACSRLESAPGRKDARRVQQFVSAARAAAAEQKLVSL